MVFVTLLWSTAGVVTRQLESAGSFEVTFWRSAFALLALGLYFGAIHGRTAFVQIRRGGRSLWLSGAMWSVMFTCFMVALTLTSVANVLITMSVAPLVTAVLARFMLGQPVARHTWLAIVVAGLSIAWMYGHNLNADPQSIVGTIVALGVPIAAAINWNTLQRQGDRVDLVPALLIGALVSSLATLPLSLPFAASVRDIALLAVLGIFQLAVPCVLAVRLASRLPAPEIALLALLEVVFGIAWAWWGAGEVPSTQILMGGAVLMGVLVLSEWWGWRIAPRRATVS